MKMQETVEQAEAAGQQRGIVLRRFDLVQVRSCGELCRLPLTNCIYGMLWPESRNVDQCVRVAGGNRRRGMMVWALNVLRRLSRESANV